MTHDPGPTDSPSPPLPTTQPTPYAPPKAPINPYAPPGQGTGTPPALWNPDVAGIWSLFLSPAFGSTLIFLNYRALREDSKANGAIFWILLSVIMIVVSALIPGIALLWIIFWYFAFQRKQSRYVTERWGKNYPKKGWIVPIFGMLVVLFGFGIILGLAGLVGGA